KSLLPSRTCANRGAADDGPMPFRISRALWSLTANSTGDSVGPGPGVGLGVGGGGIAGLGPGLLWGGGVGGGPGPGLGGRPIGCRARIRPVTAVMTPAMAVSMPGTLFQNPPDSDSPMGIPRQGMTERSVGRV